MPERRKQIEAMVDAQGQEGHKMHGWQWAWFANAGYPSAARFPGDEDMEGPCQLVLNGLH
jgi:hypothetical protein